MARNLTQLLEDEIEHLAEELETIRALPADVQWGPERGPTPLETKLGRQLAVFKELSKYHYQKASIYIRTMGLTGTLGTDRVMAMLREIEGMQAQRQIEAKGGADVPSREDD